MKRENTNIYNSLKLIVKSSFIILIGIFLSKLFSYFYKIIVARNFGPEAYGLFSLAIMVAGLITAFFTFGLSEGVLRYISFYRGKNEKNKISHIFKISLITLIFSGIISGIFLFFSASFISLTFFHNTELIPFLKIFSIIVPLSIILSLFLSVLRAYELIGWNSTISNIFQGAIKLILLILLIILGFKTNAIIFSYLIGTFATLFLAYLVAKHYIPSVFDKYLLKSSVKKKLNLELFSYSWPLMFSAFLTSIFFWTDTFVIGYFLKTSDVGFYNAAVPLAALLLVPTDLFIRLFLPLITKEYSQKNIVSINELSKQVSKWTLILNIPLLVLMIVFPGVFINLFFGKEYLIAENSLRLLAMAYFFLSMCTIPGSLLLMIGKSKTVLMNTIVFFFFNLILNIFLVGKYGIEGVAFATMLTSFLLFITSMIQSKHFLNIVPLRRKMANILIIAILITGFVFYIKHFISINILSLVLFGILFLILYTVLIILTKSLDKNDILIISSLKNKVLNITGLNQFYLSER